MSPTPIDPGETRVLGRTRVRVTRLGFGGAPLGNLFRPIPEPQAVDTVLPGVKLAVAPSPHTKCERCWHYRPDVGADPEHPEICGRCVANLYGGGEVRTHA